MRKFKIEVKQPAKAKDKVPFEVLATAIRDISKFGKLIESSALKKRTTMLLIRDNTDVSLENIRKVLEALPQLEKEYLK